MRWVWVQTAWAQICAAKIWLRLHSAVLRRPYLISVHSTDPGYLSDLSCHDIFTFLAQKDFAAVPFCPRLDCSPVLHHLLHFLVPLSLPQVPPHAAGTQQTHPGDSHTQSSHLSPRYKLHVCPNRWVCMFRVQIWASSLQPLSCLSTPHLRRECVRSCYLPLCVAIRSMCSYTCICIMLPQEELWAVPRKAFGNWFGKSSGNVCAKLSHGFVSITAAFGPGAVTEDQNREFLQRSSRYSADRAQLTHF